MALSIAWSVAGTFARGSGDAGPKTLFGIPIIMSQLTRLSETLAEAEEFSAVAVKEWNDEIILKSGQVTPGASEKIPLVFRWPVWRGRGSGRYNGRRRSSAHLGNWTKRDRSA